MQPTDMTKADSKIGWVLVLLIMGASVAVSILRGGNLPFILGGAVGLMIFPTMIFGLCGWLTKAIFKRPMGRFGLLTSFFTPWGLLVASVLVEASRRS